MVHPVNSHLHSMLLATALIFILIDKKWKQQIFLCTIHMFILVPFFSVAARFGVGTIGRDGLSSK